MQISSRKLNEVMATANISRTDLSKVTKFSYQRIWQITTDETSHVADLAAAAIAMACGVTVKELEVTE